MTIYCVGCAIVFGVGLDECMHKNLNGPIAFLWLVVLPVLSWVAVGLLVASAIDSEKKAPSDTPGA